MATISFDACTALAAVCHARGQTVALAVDPFDLLHPGVLQLIEAARTRADVVVACVVDDGSAPVTPAAERAEVVAALASVDAAVVLKAREIPSLVDGVNALAVVLTAAPSDEWLRMFPAGSKERLVVASSEWSTDRVLNLIARRD
jgi:bifunctional ADP-heptose synthase (sugar kinase/adenylyltransferase)